MPRLEAEFDEYRIGKSWGLTPRQWREQSVDDRAVMVTVDMHGATCEAYRQEEREKKKGSGKRDGLRDTNDYELMKKQFGI